jgi:hypothetical protein
MAPVARAGGVLPLLAAVVAAAALAGAAVFTVSQASCTDPGHIDTSGVNAHLVGGCVDRGDLPATAPTKAEAGQAVIDRGGLSQSRP